jgi:hypothetical protein
LVFFVVVFCVRLDIMLICENVSRLQFFNNKFESFKYASFFCFFGLGEGFV